MQNFWILWIVSVCGSHPWRHGQQPGGDSISVRHPGVHERTRSLDAWGLSPSGQSPRHSVISGLAVTGHLVANWGWDWVKYSQIIWLPFLSTGRILHVALYFFLSNCQNYLWDSTSSYPPCLKSCITSFFYLLCSTHQTTLSSICYVLHVAMSLLVAIPHTLYKLSCLHNIILPVRELCVYDILSLPLLHNGCFVLSIPTYMHCKASSLSDILYLALLFSIRYILYTDRYLLPAMSLALQSIDEWMGGA